MSSDVCESWEDILKEDILSKKVESIELDNSKNGDLNPSDSTDKSVQSNGNSGLQVLKRNKKQNRKVLDLDILDNSIGSTNGDVKVVLAKRNVQVVFDENNSSPFASNVVQMPQVKILQRPKNESNANQNNQPSAIKNGNIALKTFQEREAEYAKARLRILGSAVPNYEDKETKSSLLPPTGNGTLKEDNLSRQPQGPNFSTNTKGFAVRR